MAPESARREPTRTYALVRRALALLLAVIVAVIGACTTSSDNGTGDGDGDGSSATTGGAPAAQTRLASLPLERTEVSGAFWDGRIVVLGGLTEDGGASARVDGYDAEADTWRPLPDLPVPVHHAGIAAAGDRLFVIGGYSNGPGEQWELQAGTYVLTPGAPAWRAVTSLPEARGALAAAAFGDRVYAVGGVTADGVSTRVESLAADGAGAWALEPAMDVAREHLAVTADGDRIYAIAGRAPGNLDTVESWAADADSWQRERPVGHPRSGIAAALVDGRVCVAGGEGPDGTIAPIECLRGGTWVVVARLATPRHGLAVVEAAGRLHVISGGPRPGLTVSGVHEAFDLPT